MDQFEPLIGAWHAEGEIPTDPPMKVSTETQVERLGEFIVIRTVGEPAEMPDSVSIIGGAPDGEPQPMHYFDVARGQAAVPDGPGRLHLEDLAGARRGLERPRRPGFNQRFIGEISADGATIEGRWERGLGASGDQWEVDFPLRYVRRPGPSAST